MMRRLGIVAGVTAAWLVAAWLSGSIEVEPRYPQLWIPSGIALGAVLVFGRWAAVGAAIGALAFVLWRGAPLHIALSIAAISGAEAWAVAYVLVRGLGFRGNLERLRDVLALLVGAVVVALAAASMTAAMQVGFGNGFSSALVATRWWSHVTADLIFAPIIVSLAHAKRRDIGGLVIASSINLAIAGVAITTWLAGISPFTSLGKVQIFTAITSLTTLALAALAAERNRAVVRKTAIQEAALDAIVSVNAHGMICEYNPAAEALFGVPARVAMGCSAVELLIPELDRIAAVRALARYGDTPAEDWHDQRVRYMLMRADGDEFAAEIAVTRVQVRDEILFTGFVRDISIEVNAEAERRQSRELLELQVNERTSELIRANEELKRRDELVHQAQSLAHLGSFEYDVSTRRLQWSDELAHILGRDPATFSATAERLLGCVHPEDRARVRTLIIHAVHSERSFACQLRVVRPGGVIAFVELEGRVERDEHDRPMRITGYCQDVTDRERAEQARHRLIHLVETSADAICSLSLDGKIETWNTAGTRIFGYTADEVIGRPATMLVPEKYRSDLERLLVKVRDGQTLAHYEMPHQRRDGSVFDVSVAMSAIVDHTGRIVGLSKVLRDITEQKLVEQKVRQSLREKEVLLREIHHRVKNNLQVISSLLNLQVERLPSAAARHALAESQSRIQSMALVHQLLYRSKDFAHIDFLEYLETVVESLVRSYMNEATPVDTTVHGTRIQLDIDRAITCGLIVTELVTNALRHAFQGRRSGHLEIDVEARDGEVLLDVRDDGSGISEAAKAGSNTFGLQIARTLTQQLAGSIDIGLDHGTVVHVRFPFDQAAAAA